MYLDDSNLPRKSRKVAIHFSSAKKSDPKKWWNSYSRNGYLQRRIHLLLRWHVDNVGESAFFGKVLHNSSGWWDDGTHHWEMKHWSHLTVCSPKTGRKPPKGNESSSPKKGFSGTKNCWVLTRWTRVTNSQGRGDGRCDRWSGGLCFNRSKDFYLHSGERNVATGNPPCSWRCISYWKLVGFPLLIMLVHQRVYLLSNIMILETFKQLIGSSDVEEAAEQFYPWLASPWWLDG